MHNTDCSSGCLATFKLLLLLLQVNIYLKYSGEAAECEFFICMLFFI